MSRRAAIWLPPAAEWAEALALFGTEAEFSADHPTTFEAARAHAIELLHANAVAGQPAILIRASIAAAKAVAAEIGADMTTEVGRASTAAKLAENLELPVKTTLGLAMGAGQPSNCAWVGWALVQEAETTEPGKHVVEIVIGEGDAPF